MKKYLINDEEVNEEEFNAQLEDDVDRYCEDIYDDMIDDTNEEVHIGSLTYSPSLVLKCCDEVAYRCGLSDYQSCELSDAQYQLNQYGEVDVLDDTFTVEEIVE
jgi:hypothetical protein